MPIRDELMNGDLRALYIAWLAEQLMRQGYDPDDLEEDERDEDRMVPAIPPGLGKLTEAQQALADLLDVTPTLLTAAARHSRKATPSAAEADDFATWIERLPQERRNDYLLRLANNEPGLSRQLVQELRALGPAKTQAAPSQNESIPYATLLRESKVILDQQEREEQARQAQRAREQKEQDERARQLRMQEVHDHQETYWRQIDQNVATAAGARYDEAVRLLTELRDAATQFKETQQFQTRFNTWVRAYTNRPALITRLKARKFPLPTK